MGRDIIALISRNKYKLSEEFYEILYSYVDNKNNTRFLRVNNFNLKNTTLYDVLANTSGLLTHYFIACKRIGRTPNPYDVEVIQRGIRDLMNGEHGFCNTAMDIVKRVLGEVHDE